MVPKNHGTTSILTAMSNRMLSNGFVESEDDFNGEENDVPPLTQP